MKKVFLALTLIVGLTVAPTIAMADAVHAPATMIDHARHASIAPAMSTAPMSVSTTGYWWCFANGVPTVQTPYSDPGPAGRRNAIIWCKLNYDQSDAGFLE